MIREHIVERLAANAGAFRDLTWAVSDAQARWKPLPDKWSILEVICHLADEERHDFRKRLALLAKDPLEHWPPIDPQRWAIERGYNSRNLADCVADFLDERERSLAWLRSVPDLALGANHHHPHLGTLTAGDLLVSWLAHDLIHIRQINRLHFEYLSTIASPFTPGYAGIW